MLNKYKIFLHMNSVIIETSKWPKGYRSIRQSIDEFDSVICCNDLCAVLLVASLRERGIPVPERLWVAAIGKSVLGVYTLPSITSTTLESFSIGKQVIELCMLLIKNPILTLLYAGVDGTLQVRGSTGFVEADIRYHPSIVIAPDFESVNFYSDDVVQEIFNLENLFSHCDDVDFKILEGIFKDCRYRDMAEQLHLSENTLKYRLRRMMRFAQCDNRFELLNLITKYLDQNNLKPTAP